MRSERARPRHGSSLLLGLGLQHAAGIRGHLPLPFPSSTLPQPAAAASRASRAGVRIRRSASALPFAGLGCRRRGVKRWAGYTRPGLRELQAREARPSPPAIVALRAAAVLTRKQHGRGTGLPPARRAVSARSLHPATVLFCRVSSCTAARCRMLCCAGCRRSHRPAACHSSRRIMPCASRGLKLQWAMGSACAWLSMCLLQHKRIFCLFLFVPSLD